MEYGFTSEIWMSKQLIKNADPTYVKLSVIRLMDELWREATKIEGREISTLEIFDRLIQVACTGEYTAPTDVREVVEEALHHASDILSREGWAPKEELPDDEAEEILKRFREMLGVDEDEDDEDD